MKLQHKQLRLCLILVFVSILPFTGISQKANQCWTTPIQNVEFNDSMIVVTNSWDALQVFDNLKPVLYDISLIKILNVHTISSHKWDGYQNYEKQLSEFVKDWEIGLANNRDKQKFLESCVLLILLNAPSNNSVPESIPLILEYLEQDKMKDLAHNASLVKALYESYFKKL